MLLLFDIDQTLVDTDGAGLAALRRAFARLHKIDDPESIVLDLAGSTDRSVFAEFTALQSVEPTEEAWERFAATYLEELERTLAQIDGRVLPGVERLLQRLASDEDHHLSLLTGNLRAGAELKLRHFDLADYFDFESGAWGGERADRNRLGPLAIKRAGQRLGRSVRPGETLIVGDTPRDIACAHACGAHSLGVATGRFTTEELRAAQAGHVLADLGDTEVVLARIAALG